MGSTCGFLRLPHGGYRVGVTPVFGTRSVLISAGVPTILTEMFRGFPQSLQLNVGIVSPLGGDLFFFTNAF
jgi:hypothetical protein